MTPSTAFLSELIGAAQHPLQSVTTCNCCCKRSAAACGVHVCCVSFPSPTPPGSRSPVWHEVQVEHGHHAQLHCARCQHTQHANHESVTGQHHIPLTGLEQVAVGVIVAACFARGAGPQVEGEGQQGPRELEAAQTARGLLNHSRQHQAEQVKQKTAGPQGTRRTAQSHLSGCSSQSLIRSV